MGAILHTKISPWPLNFCIAFLICHSLIPLTDLVHCYPVVELLSSGLLHSMLGSLFYSLEAGLLLARSSLLGYLGFYKVETAYTMYIVTSFLTNTNYQLKVQHVKSCFEQAVLIYVSF